MASLRARPTCSTVMTPDNRPSASTAIRAPSLRRFWLLSSASSGVSSRMKRPRSWSTKSETWSRAGNLGDLVGAVAVEQAEEAMGGVDDREPGPAVAQEVFVERFLDADLARDRDRLAVHHVGDTDVARCGWSAPSASPRHERAPLTTIPIRASQTPPKTSPVANSRKPPAMKT